MTAIRPFTDEDMATMKAAFSDDPDTGKLSHLLKKRNGRGGFVMPGDQAGHVHKASGYTVVAVNGRLVGAHRVAWALRTGKCPGDQQIDHIDHDRSNNRWNNLRLVDAAGNKKNESLRKDNKSGFPGVCLLKSEKKWLAYYYADGKRIDIGRFESKDDAIAARKAVNENAGFHANHGIASPRKAA